MSDAFDLQAVVFDMDGVIFDTEPLYYNAEDLLLQRRGRRFSPAAAERIMGLPGVEAMELLRRDFGLTDSAEELYAETQEIFRASLEIGLQLMPGFDKLLDLCRSRRIPCAVATSTRRELAVHMLTTFRLVERFAFILTREDVVAGKPDPEVYRLACKRLGAAPVNSLVLEDSLNGVRSAVAAGCFTAAVRHSHNRHISFAQAQFVAESMADPRLAELIGGSYRLGENN